MSDAPTTTPTTTTTTTSWWSRIGGIVASPRRTFHAIVDEGRGHPVEPLLVYAVVVLAIAAAEVYRLVALGGTAPLIVLNRLLDVVLRAGRTDFAVVIGAAVVVGAVARAFGKRFVNAAIATTYLLVLLAVAKAIGGICALAGLELWFLPHRAVDSFAVVVNGRVDVARFTIKLITAYGPGLVVLLAWVQARGRSMEPPRPFTARIGLAFVVVVVGMLGIGAIANVAGRTEQLRPRLAGDAFPSLPLKNLDGRGRVDILALAQTKGTRVVVVDFWASWCAPCRRSMPELSALAEGWQGKGVVVVGVNREPTELVAARKAWAELGPPRFSWTLVDDRGLGEKIGLTSLPSSYILDSKGVIRHLHLGYTDAAVVAAEVEALLQESP
ncbi:MAG: TlpA disulfide reductase family protein [Deltaproteobacteria bacterium]|nr:TlpA disulfide reductase family protein [Deltaproteobacteria bacterium]